jgi:glycosyltransferase involved in cell wall biosynthesis
VGDLASFGDYASRTNQHDRTRALTLLDRLRPRVEHHRSMPADGVVQLLKQSDYYLLPTYGDTFGYSVLEAQACGSIPIVTNVRSLPEIVTEADGFIVSLDLDRDRDAHTVMSRTAMDARILDSLSDILRACLMQCRDERRRKSSLAQARLAARHAPITHAGRIAMIYEAALKQAK